MEGFDKVSRELLLDDFRREIVFLLARLGLSKKIFLIQSAIQNLQNFKTMIFETKMSQKVRKVKNSVTYNLKCIKEKNQQ